jgi:exodeoxyribonuclease-3
MKIKNKIGFDTFDKEGRFIEAEYDDCYISSVYFPSGSSGDERQKQKYVFMDVFEKYLIKIKSRDKPSIICGDWNIVHKEIDIKNWKSNQKNSGCLPEERAWLDKVFDGLGYIDAFRVVNKKADNYTWWSNRGRAWDNNVGWRIDYQVLTPGSHIKIKNAQIYKKERFSDHSPLIMNYEL